MKKEVMCTISYSGHMYRNSPYETDDRCGNCDGARCEYCHTIYKMEDLETGKIILETSNKELAIDKGWKKGFVELEIQ